MKSQEIVKKAMKSRGITQEELAKRLGYTAQAGVGRVLNTGNSMRVDKLVEMLACLDYEVVIIDKREGSKFSTVTDKKGKAVKPKKHLTKEEAGELFAKKEERKEIPVFQYGKQR